MRNQEKFHSSFLSKILYIIILNIWSGSSVEAQNLKPNIEIEYANTLASLGEYSQSSEIFNKNIEYLYHPNIAFAVLANYKVGNYKFMDLWAKQLIANHYKNKYKDNFYTFDLTENERDEIFSRLNSIFDKEIGLIVKSTDFELENKISSLLSVDQYFRANFNSDIQIELDSEYIFSDIIDLMLTDIDGEALSFHSKFAINIILLHQSDYINQFNKMCDLELIEKMLKKSVLKPYEYACIYDRNSLAKNKKMKYGTLYTEGYYQSLEGFDLEEINKNRLSIGLCELQYDYRNQIPIIQDEILMKQEILERLKAGH
ncbi:MAG: hypothetical protein H6572_06310 [Lewinellaceae bacterium]|nr:hypothetical protein [Lewinellaceae bacterium]